jgi:diaminopimelate epimerase
MDEKKIAKINIETAAGILQCHQDGDLIAVNMGTPQFGWQEIPLSKNLGDNFKIDNLPYKFNAVNMGNPHIVAFLDQELSDEEFLEIAPKLETHSLFPQKTNVEFAQILSQSHIKVRVWERGAGETLACGTGACAVAVAAIKQNLTNADKIKISFKGGDLFIEYQENQVIMTGGYEKIFSGIINKSFLNRII